jgi:hypothetical protein
MSTKTTTPTDAGIAQRVRSLDNRRIDKIQRLMEHEIKLLCDPASNPKGFAEWQSKPIERQYRDLYRYITGV